MLVLRHKLAQFVALGLLFFAGLDLGFPSLCQAESVLPSTSHSDASSLDEHGPEPTAPKQGPEEDCFCCCVHIRPQPVTRGVASLIRLGEKLVTRPSFKPEFRVGTLFHPPKL